jgi:hypothetical protein
MKIKKINLLKALIICMSLGSAEIYAVTFDVELVCKKTTLFIDRGKVLAGFNKFKSNEMQKRDNVYQLYREYCFVREENMTLRCDDYVRLDKDTIWTQSGNELDRKTLTGSLNGLGGGLECTAYTKGSDEFRDELTAKQRKFNNSVKENQI